MEFKLRNATAIISVLLAATPAQAVSHKHPTAVSGWTYKNTHDNMRDTDTRQACRVSVNSVQLDSPYKSQRLRLCISQTDLQNPSAWIEFTGRGQFHCVQAKGCVIYARFDDKPVDNYSIEPLDEPDDNLTFKNPFDLIDALVPATKVIFEVPIYEGGDQQVTFDLRGLNWKRLP